VQKIIEVQVSSRDLSSLDDALRMASEGSPFPLNARVSRKDLVVKDIRLETGRFTVILGPAPKPASQPATSAAASTSIPH